MKFFQVLTVCSLGFLALSAQARADQAACDKALELLESAEALFEEALAEGDLASGITTRHFDGAEPQVDEVQRLEEHNSQFAQKATDGVGKVDELGNLIFELGKDKDAATRAKLSAVNLPVGELVQSMKPRLTRYLFSGMSTIDCPMPWEEGYARCVSGKITPYYVANERVQENGGKIQFKPGMSKEEFKAALLGQTQGESKLVRVEHYASVRARIASGMKSIRNTVEKGLCE